MLSKEIRQVIEEARPWAEVLEEYDRTGAWPLRKVRKDFTLEARSVSKLERMAKERSISRSRMLDRLIQGS